MPNKINSHLVNLILGVILSILVLVLFEYINLLEKLIELFIALAPFYIGFFIAWLMKPLGLWISKRTKISIKISNFISIFISIFVLLIVILVILPMAIVQFGQLIVDSGNIISDLKLRLSFLNLDATLFVEFYDKYLAGFVAKIDTQDVLKGLNIAFDSVTYVITAVYGVINFVIQIVLAYIIAFYFINDISSFAKKSIRFLSHENAPHHYKNALEVSRVLFGYFRGLVIICSFIGIVVGIGCSLIGLPSPVLFGVFAAFTNVIPYIGPIIGGIPVMIIALSLGFDTFLLALVVVFGTQFIESNFLQPKIMSKSSNLHPVSIIVGLIIFGNLFGILGMMISTPIIAAINVIIKNSRFDIHL